MKLLQRYFLICLFFVVYIQTSEAQNDVKSAIQDTSNASIIKSYKIKFAEIEKLRRRDSIQKKEIEQQLINLKASDKLTINELKEQINELNEKELQRIARKKTEIDSLRKTINGFPVIGPLKDTLFIIYAQIGTFSPRDRALRITAKISEIMEDDFVNVDSISFIEYENIFEIIYKDNMLMSVFESDALWNNKSQKELASEYTAIVKAEISKATEEGKLINIIIRVGLVLLVIGGVWLIFWSINRLHKAIIKYIGNRKDRLLKNLTYKDYTFLSAEQELKLIFFVIRTFKWFILILLFYLIFPLVFSIFPFTRNWADVLFYLVWSPLKIILIGIWEYLPNVFTILVIYFVMKYFIRFVKYVFNEIETEKLIISGFHADWAMPTFSIVRFLLYAFMFVLIFPYLPGSDSNIFRGVSVFLGVLFSLGSSSAIANLIAGLVITYMRPYKIGDRIKIGEMTGDVIEKTMLVTRLRAIKNEEITIPNSSVLSGNTINYSAYSKKEGLIINTTVTIGYSVPWKDMHQALIDAALRTKLVLQEPKPFVLQTSLNDFYVSYQINAYINEANLQVEIYSDLHQNIQDVCNERNIEIMSPHYQAARDGNSSAIPAGFLPKDYTAPSFKVKIEKDNE